jgi:hypothetical protein
MSSRCADGPVAGMIAEVSAAARWDGGVTGTI